MEEKKNFFELLSPKSALLVGAVAGVLTLGTIGFFVMLATSGGNSAPKVEVAGVKEVAATPPTPSQQQPTTPVVTKSAKPKIELFVMSYCPYGLMMEKAYAPAWNLLKDKVDISVKFVSYAMHGLKEINENSRQYCIQKDQPEKYLAYLNCFFTAGQNDGSEANFATCLTAAKVDANKVNSCMGVTDKQFGIMAKYNDQTTWLSGRYPIYGVHSDLNTKYGVQGSPTLIINGAEANVARSPEAVKQAICASFDTAPAECSKTLDTTTVSAGFGLGAGAAGGTAAGCATN